MAMSGMDMGSSMAMTSTASAHSMASTGMAGMSGMDMGSMDGMDMSMMSMADMMMTFFTSTTTPLFSQAWTPTSTGAYAGTCIFLIAFAVLFRSLLAIRSNFGAFMSWASHTRETEILRSDYDKVSGRAHGAGASGEACKPARAWNINEALIRALLDTILAGVGYLLMLAVMTMNVGYFMSVLGGTFLGSFIFGGYTAASGH